MSFKKIIYTLFFLIFLAWFIDVFALDSATSSKILSNFKKLEYEMIFESDDMFIDEEDKQIINSSRKMTIYEGISDKIQESRESLEEESEKVKERVKSFKSAILELEQDIQKTSEEITDINNDIVTIQRQIVQWQKDISFLKVKVKSNREVLLNYIVHLYKKWNNIYEWDSMDNLKAILLSGEDIWELINDMQFKSSIEITWNQLVSKYRASIYKLYITNANLKEQQDKVKQLRKATIIKRKVLDDKKELKTKLFNITKWKENLYQKYIDEKLELEKKVQLKLFIEKLKFDKEKNEILKKYGCDFVDVSKDTPEVQSLEWKCLEINNIIYAESKLGKFDSSKKNVFAWPTRELYWVTAFFHDKDYKAQFGVDHEAVDLAVPQGTEIIAPANGYVIYIQPPVNDWYAYVALKHSDWFVTIYGHVSEVMVKQYDFVKKWEAFAKSWGLYWTKWAWYMTTWAHLHFWVFKDKQYVDPLNYLDISHFSIDSLPDKYRYKFYYDFKNSRWYEYKRVEENNWIFRITWDTEIERQKNLLAQYASWPFKDWNMWVEEAIAWNIDPTFLICVWVAESSLWNHLKTSYNIWNVWNTDSGGTYEFANAREWVYWIVKTLNNRILWKYTQVKELSRYWNKTWPIYASSAYNWHNNVIKCMSHLKWEYVEDDYNFRLDN